MLARSISHIPNNIRIIYIMLNDIYMAYMEVKPLLL